VRGDVRLSRPVTPLTADRFLDNPQSQIARDAGFYISRVAQQAVLGDHALERLVPRNVVTGRHAPGLATCKPGDWRLLQESVGLTQIPESKVTGTKSGSHRVT